MARAQTNGQDNRREERNALVVHEPRMPPPPAEYLEKLGINAGQWKTLVEAVWPSAKTVDGVVMALEYCKSRQLDPFKKPVHIVPMWNSELGQEVETVWPGINDYRTTASRTGLWAGNDDCLFGPVQKRPFKDAQERGRGQKKYVQRAECDAFEFPEWAQVTVYKIIQGQRVPFVGPKVRFVEIFSGEKGLRVPNSRWRQAPWQMLEKCAEAAALRRAFPEEFAGTYTAEEMEGKEFHRGPTIEATAVYHGAGDERPGDPEAEERPTRESDQEKPWQRLGIAEEHWTEIERIQVPIDGTKDVGVLRDTKERYVADYMEAGWSDAALDELERRFDRRIDQLQGRDQRDLPLDSDDAGASADNGQTASEDGDEQTD